MFVHMCVSVRPYIFSNNSWLQSNLRYLHCSIIYRTCCCCCFFLSSPMLFHLYMAWDREYEPISFRIYSTRCLHKYVYWKSVCAHSRVDNEKTTQTSRNSLSHSFSRTIYRAHHAVVSCYCCIFFSSTHEFAFTFASICAFSLILRCASKEQNINFYLIAWIALYTSFQSMCVCIFLSIASFDAKQI